MNHHAFSKIWTLIILIAFIGGGILAWQYFGAPEEEAKAPEDKTANWKTYMNKDYGFEIKYSNNWKQCDIYKGGPSLELARFTGVDQKCFPSPYDKPNDRLLISTEPEILNSYPTHSELKKVLEEAMLSGRDFEIGFENLKKIEEITLDNKIVLKTKVLSVYDGSSYTRIFIFYEENLFSILYSLISLDREVEINQMLSTFKFLE